MDKDFWFSKKVHKFLHNIDTFYFSVKFVEDFTKESQDPAVKLFRDFITRYDSVVDLVPFHLPIRDALNYKPQLFKQFYTFHLECCGLYDIFFAPKVPEYDGTGSVTPEMIVQIRSKLLWEVGVTAAFERAMVAVNAFADMFKLHILEVKENRVDFCWHTNDLAQPEKYFTPENLNRMAVTRLGRRKDDEGSRARIDFVMKGDDGVVYDYTAIGKRGEKCLIRFYLKSKEVIQENYKPWFLQLWLFHNLISRYDFYVLDLAYKHHSWPYVDIARLHFALEYLELSDVQREEIRQLLAFENSDKDDKPNYPAIRKLAKQLTPEVTKIYNVEYQVMRKMSKTFCIIQKKDNESKGVCQRIYDFLDNRNGITEYLTRDTFRLIDRNTDSNRSRCDYTDFWKRLRAAKQVDVSNKHCLKLMREYSKNLDVELRKKRAARMIASFGAATNPTYDMFTDTFELLSLLNDNDLVNLENYKKRQILRLPRSEVIEDDYSPGD